MKIGPRIRKYRKKSGLSVAECAKQLKVKETDFEKWETNQLDIDSYHATKLAKLLKVTTKELTGKDFENEDEKFVTRFFKMFIQNLLIITAIMAFIFIVRAVISSTFS